MCSTLLLLFIGLLIQNVQTIQDQILLPSQIIDEAMTEFLIEEQQYLEEQAQAMANEIEKVELQTPIDQSSDSLDERSDNFSTPLPNFTSYVDIKDTFLPPRYKNPDLFEDNITTVVPLPESECNVCGVEIDSQETQYVESESPDLESSTTFEQVSQENSLPSSEDSFQEMEDHKIPDDEDNSIGEIQNGQENKGTKKAMCKLMTYVLVIIVVAKFVQ
eukprot:TRINITY_DN143_c0_g1_i4.p2 TRINITY_DN143_c0_g1~~TRINITY_DN143_c0_g1_i4.p2  ORF type:complete len:218 (+),score=23.64 TRINITY_DN143_c0_g1_i4:67-720(+)